MKERPILFNGEMVNAILDGRKPQTRRTRNLDYINKNPNDFEFSSSYICGLKGCKVVVFKNKVTGKTYHIECTFGKEEDVLWVRETWYHPNKGSPSKFNLSYKADGDDVTHRWYPSIHMPRWASRITLEITDIRVERVQDISEDDALAEGIPEEYGIVGATCAGGTHSEIMGNQYFDLVNEDETYNCPIEAFNQLWNSINESRGFGWDVNPWVWVVEFKMVEGE